RPVAEDVPEVRVGAARTDLDAQRPEGPVAAGHHALGLDRLREARPPRARVILVERAEERLAVDRVDVQAGTEVVPVSVLKRRLCRVAGGAAEEDGPHREITTTPSVISHDYRPRTI